MPVYDYVCTACGTRVEVIHGVHAAGPAVCTACGGALRKAVSAAAIVYKGSGWAKKDARDRSTASTAGSSKGERGGGEGSATDTAKPAKMADTAVKKDGGGGATKGKPND
jgi:putative FmdB family regulatory protein